MAMSYRYNIRTLQLETAAKKYKGITRAVDPEPLHQTAPSSQA